MEAEEVLQLHVETENCDNGALSSTDHEAVLTLREVFQQCFSARHAACLARYAIARLSVCIQGGPQK